MGIRNLSQVRAGKIHLKKGVEEILRILRREPRLTSGEFDPTRLPSLLGKDDPVILDIGCNDGGHTLLFLTLFKEPKVYSFEPDPRALERFRNKVKDTRAKLFNVAISSVDGYADFHISDGLPSEEWKATLPKGWDMSGSIRKPKRHLDLHPWCTFNELVRVETRRLDTWCSNEGVDSIDFIWADVQGAEVDLIKGGGAALRHTRYFYTEYSDRELYEGQVSLRTMLKMLPDFEVVERYENDVLLKNKRYK